eukprot:COSAG06_NODE_77826_length_113_cov_87.928571_1_plen_28_part_10
MLRVRRTLVPLSKKHETYSKTTTPYINL